MSAFYTDGNFALKWPIGKARVSYPIPGDVATYLRGVTRAELTELLRTAMKE